MNNNKLHAFYRPDIDGLRAVAIIAVVIFHAFPNFLPGGFVGVDVFFVISGYLISRIIFKSFHKGEFLFSIFFSRRVNRIFPSLIIVLSFCYFFGWFTLLPDEFRQLGKHVLAGSGFVQNFILWKEDSYFTVASDLKPLMHLWSLSIEEQFYIVYPFLLFFAWKNRFPIWLLLTIFILISFGLNLFLVDRDIVQTFFISPTRFWEMLAGATLAYFETFNKAAIKLNSFTHFKNCCNRFIFFLKEILSVIGLSLILWASIKFDNNQQFPGWRALVPVTGAFLIISAGPKALMNRFILSNRFMIFIGLISYPLYLWHWPILSYPKIINPEILTYGFKWVAVFASFLLSICTYKLVEKPIKKWKDSWRVSGILVLHLLVIASFGFYTLSSDGNFNRFWLNNMNIRYAQFTGPLWSYENNDICKKKYSFKKAKKFDYWFCMLNKSEDPTILLLGNSYANQLYPGFILNENLKNNAILSIGNSDPAEENEVKFYIDNIIKNTKSLRFVIIAGLPLEPNFEFMTSLKKRISDIDKLGKQIIVFNPHIIPPFDSKECFSRPLGKKRDCSFEQEVKIRIDERFSYVQKEISSVAPSALFFDQNEVFCFKSHCSYVKDDMPLHRDKSHISEFASKEIAKNFVKWSQTNIPAILNNSLTEMTKN